MKTVHIKVLVEASDTETAIRKAIWRIWEARPCDIIEDRCHDIDRMVEEEINA